MTLRKPICVAGGERSLRSKVRAQASFFPHPQRHDPSAAPSLSTNQESRSPLVPEKISGSRGGEGSWVPDSFPLLLPYGERWSLVVVRNTGMFRLLEICNGAIRVAVRAPSAQMIIDYLNANWPVGTIAHWIVVPPFQSVDGDGLPPGRGHIGARARRLQISVRAESAHREVGRGLYGEEPDCAFHSSARAFKSSSTSTSYSSLYPERLRLRGSGRWRVIEALRLSLVCLAIAIIFRLLFQIVNAQDAVPVAAGVSPAQPARLPLQKQVELAFHFSDGEPRTWLTIVNHDPRATDFHPSYTNMVTYLKPLVRKLPSGEYEITFVSEIAEDLP
jgi:hypothetical protein